MAFIALMHECVKLGNAMHPECPCYNHFISQGQGILYSGKISLVQISQNCLSTPLEENFIVSIFALVIATARVLCVPFKILRFLFSGRPRKTPSFAPCENFLLYSSYQVSKPRSYPARYRDAACARHEAAIQPCDQSNIAIWVWFQFSTFAEGVVQMTGEDNIAYEGLGPFY